MLGTLHNDTYFARMAASLGDKARLIEWLVPGTTIDVGAGDGGLVRAIGERAGYVAYGVDASEAAVARSDGSVRFGSSPGLRTAFPEVEQVENVVMSAVLHEIHSYAQPHGLAVSEEAVAEAAAWLSPGGRLLIRDGVGPDDPETELRVRFVDPSHGAAFHAAWHEISQQLGPERASARTRIEPEDGCLYGTARDITAFLVVFVWGEGSLAREAQEDYTCAGALGVRADQLTAWTGLQVIHTESYTQPGYIEHWEKLCSVEQLTGDEDGWVRRDWPATNAMWILEN